MSRPEFKKIRNWADLQEEKRRLNTILDAKEGLLADRWGRIKNSSKDILYNKILLPLSVMSVGAVLVRIFRSVADSGSPSSGTHEKQDDGGEKTAFATDDGRDTGWFSSKNIEVMAQAAKILLPVILAAFASDEEEEARETAEKTGEQETASEEAVEESEESSS